MDGVTNCRDYCAPEYTRGLEVYTHRENWDSEY